jgi:hypothetical protein
MVHLYNIFHGIFTLTSHLSLFTRYSMFVLYKLSLYQQTFRTLVFSILYSQLLFCSFLPFPGKYVCGNKILIWKSKGLVFKGKTLQYKVCEATQVQDINMADSQAMRIRKMTERVQ